MIFLCHFSQISITIAEKHHWAIAMHDSYKIYSGENLSNTYVVISEDTYLEVIPFNLRYMFGDMLLIKGGVTEAFLPFGISGRKKIVEIVSRRGYCFYKWPGKVLGESLE